MTTSDNKRCGNCGDDLCPHKTVTPDSLCEGWTPKPAPKYVAVKETTQWQPAERATQAIDQLVTPIQDNTKKTCGNCGEQGIGPLKKNQNCRPCHVNHDYRNWKPVSICADCTTPAIMCPNGNDPKEQVQTCNSKNITMPVEQNEKELAHTSCFGCEKYQVGAISRCNVRLCVDYDTGERKNYTPKPICSICGMIRCNLSVSDHLRFDEERKMRDANKQPVPVDNAKLDLVISRCKNHIPYPLEVGEQPPPLVLDKLCKTCGGDPSQHDMMCDGVEQPVITKTCANCYIKCYNFKYRKQGEDCCEHWSPEPIDELPVTSDDKLKTVTFKDVQAICNPQKTIGCNRSRSLLPASFAFLACKKENCREWENLNDTK